MAAAMVGCLAPAAAQTFSELSDGEGPARG